MIRFSAVLLVWAALSGVSGIAQQPQPITQEDHGVLTIVGMPPNAPSIYSGKEVKVHYGNKFRYDLGAQTTQTPIGSAALPGGLGPSSAEIAKLPNAIAEPAAPAAAPQDLIHAKPPVVIPDYPQACDQSDTVSPWSSLSTADQVKRITKCWNGIRHDIEVERQKVAELRHKINTVIRNAGAEQRCYATNLWNFRQPILTPDQATNLINFAAANTTPDNQISCRLSNSETWPLDDADQDGTDLANLQEDLMDLATAPSYPTWANPTAVQNANTALAKVVTDLIAEVNSYSTGTAATGSGSSIAQTYNDFQTVVANNQQWRKQLSNLLSSQPPSGSGQVSLTVLEVDVAIDPCAEWYGKGRTDAVKLHAVDLSSNSGASQDIQLATNTCNPRTIASTGIGISFLPSPVFSFVPVDNTGAQVIGETASNSKSPLYAVFYNVQLGSIGHGMELFASPGIGLTSASNTTTTDFLGGLSISFARRVVFITPSADFGRRDQLAPGFGIGTPKGSLSSVPTQSHWPVQFMLSISFGIGPS